jgi:PAS domain S-box-containing protein
MGTQHRSPGVGSPALDVLSHAGSLAAAGPSLLSALFGPSVAFAALWLVDRHYGVLRCAAVWPDDARMDPFRRVTVRNVFAIGVDLPGTVWLARGPVGVDELPDAPNFQRGAEAAATRLASGLAVPIVHAGRPAAVIEGFRHEAALPAPSLGEQLTARAAGLSELLQSGAVVVGELPRSRAVGEAMRAARLVGVAELGRRALAGTAADRLAAEAVELAVAALGTDLGAFLEFRAAEQDFLVRAAVGWAPGAIGSTVPGGDASLAGFTLISDAPVLVDDYASDRRFAPHALGLAHGVVSAVSAVVRSPDRPLGVMSVLTTRRRRFEADDVAFLGLVAGTLAAAIARARADEAAQRSDALLRAIVDGTTDAVFVKDLEGRFLMINAAGARVLGRAQHEVVGLRTMDLFPSDVAQQLERTDADVVAAGEWRTYEEPIVTGEGDERVFLATKGPYRGPDGSPAGLIGIAHDITERKRAEDRQRLVAAAGRALAAGHDEPGAVREVVALVVPALADWCLIELLDPAGRVVPAAAAHAGDKGRLLDELRRRYPPTGTASAVPQVVRSGRPELYRNVDAPPAGEAHLDLLRRVGFDTAAVVPLTSGGQWIGSMTLAVTQPRAYSSADLTVFEQLADRLALALEAARLRRDRTSVTQALQRSLVPPEPPPVPGLDLAVRFHAAGAGNELAGDFYDVFPVVTGWLLVIGDVSARGSDAGWTIAAARHTLHAAAWRDARPAAVLRELNRALMLRSGGGPFCTVALALAQPAGDRIDLTVACAGHPAPLLRRASGAVTAVTASGGPLGVVRDPEFHATRLALEPADALVLFTDGVVDVGPASGWGLERLREELSGWRGAGARELATRIEARALDAHLDSADDDLAVLVARVAPAQPLP